jgi:hypothetical protein
VQLKRARILGITVIGGATAIVACSSSSSFIETGGSFGRAGGVGPSGSVSTGTTSPSTPPRCPPDAPTPGTGCSGFASICTYGPDTRDDCAEKYECRNSRWVDATGDCQVQCPTTLAEIIPGTACGDSQMACSYDDGTCGCVGSGAPEAGTADAGSSGTTDGGDAGDGGDGGKPPRVLYPGVWKCVAPPTNVACPSARPRVLDACVKSVSCDYGTCELGQPLVYDCKGGVWQESFDSPPCDE